MSECVRACACVCCVCAVCRVYFKGRGGFFPTPLGIGWCGGMYSISHKRVKVPYALGLLRYLRGYA